MNGTKDRIVEVVSGELGFLENRSIEIVETLIEIIKETLVSGDNLLVSGFGTFRVKEKKERRGRNPKTGEDLMIEPRRVVTFHCSRKLRLIING